MELLRGRNAWARYAVAPGSVALAALATRALWMTGDRAVFPLFYAAVVFSAFYGGVGPSLLATALSATIAELWLAPAVRPHVAVAAPGVRLLVFVVVALVGSTLNVALRRAREAERRAKRAAEEANAAKSRFVAMVGHELRTPLSPILLLAESLAGDPSLPRSIRQDLSTVHRNALLEARLVDDLLDVSRMSRGKLRLDMESLDVCEAVTQAVQVCATDARERQITIEVKLPLTDIPVSADRVRLQQILWNLIRNAIKFTPAGGQVRVSATRSGSAAAVSIADTGIGIAPDRMEEIFRAFEQESPDIAARFGGLGLGLAICRSLAEAQGGAVIATSDGRGHGATFTLRLPLDSRLAVRPASSLPAA